MGLVSLGRLGKRAPLPLFLEGKMTRTELWERLWGTYIDKLRRVEDLKAIGRYGYQLRMPYKSLDIAAKALLKEFPEADIYLDPGLFEERKRIEAEKKMKKPKMGLHTEDEQLQAVDLIADSFGRGQDAARERNLFGLSSEIGYHNAVRDLALQEGVEGLATIANKNLETLGQAFEQLYSELG
jgi:hypothetical protein